MTDTEIEALILKHFHGFTKEQWDAELKYRFPYCEIPAIVKGAVEQWTSVEDRLPESMEDVLCFTRLGKRMVQNCYCTAADQDENWFKEKYSHWQPLPSPPKK